MSKKYFIEDETNTLKMTKAQMGGLDTAFFLIYSIPMFFGGSIGDRYDKKRIIAIAFVIQAFGFLQLGIAATLNFYNHMFYYGCFILISLSQSMIFPTLVSIVGSWFSSKYRGLITGSWGTSANVGNIIGIHLSTAIFNLTDRRWSELMNAICGLFVFNSFLAYMLLKPDPEQDDIIINLEDEIREVEAKYEKRRQQRRGYRAPDGENWGMGA